jgi:hypothetical protein
MFNKLFSEVEGALKAYRKNKTLYNLDRYTRKFVKANAFGQQAIYKVTFRDGTYMYLNVDNLQDAKDLLEIKYPVHLVSKFEPVPTMKILSPGN